MQAINGNLIQNIKKQTYKHTMLEKYNIRKTNISIPSLYGNGPPCPNFGCTSQWNGSFGSMDKWRRERVNGLRGKWSQGTHMGSITIGIDGVF